jgi:hypothetical protein
MQLFVPNFLLGHTKVNLLCLSGNKYFAFIYILALQKKLRGARVSACVLILCCETKNRCFDAKHVRPCLVLVYF